MAVTLKNLANATMTTAATDTKGPGTGKAWIVKNIVLTNQGSSACNVSVKAVGRFIAPP